MFYSIGTASKATGKSRAAICQALASGRIQASKNDKNQWEIKPEELFKIYPPIQKPEHTAKHQDEHTENIIKIRVLEEKVKLLEQLQEELKRDRDFWRQSQEHLHENYIRSLRLISEEGRQRLERFQAAQPTIYQMPPEEGQTPPKVEPDPEPEKQGGQKRGWWGLTRFFGT